MSPERPPVPPDPRASPAPKAPSGNPPAASGTPPRARPADSLAATVDEVSQVLAGVSSLTRTVSTGDASVTGKAPGAAGGSAGSEPIAGAGTPLPSTPAGPLPVAASAAAAASTATTGPAVSRLHPPPGTSPVAGAGKGSSLLRPPVVTFRNVSKTFNPGTPQEYRALRDLTFEIEDLPDVGEFIAVVGPSGCGKSTMLNLIEGFQEVFPPTTGEILVRGQPVTGPGKDRGMIFQKYSSFPHLTVLRNVTFGLELEGAMPRRVMDELAMDWIRKVGLAGHENKYPAQLSGGQQQRVAIARTLVLKPRIILMDEPFSALDEPTRLDMQRLILKLWHEVEATVFIVTHSLAEACILGDRIWIFTPGPGTIGKIVPVPLQRPPGSDPLEIQQRPEFMKLLEQVTNAFHEVCGEQNPGHSSPGKTGSAAKAGTHTPARTKP